VDEKVVKCLDTLALNASDDNIRDSYRQHSRT